MEVLRNIWKAHGKQVVMILSKDISMLSDTKY